MKVYEIISESRILNEESTWMLVVRAASKGSGILADVLRAISAEVKVGSKTSSELAEAWVAAARTTSKDIEEVIKSGRKIAKDAGVADDAIRAAETEARASAKLLADYDKMLLPLGERIPNWLPTLINGLAISTPIYNYFKKMEEWGKKGLSKEQLEEHKRIELGILLTEMASLFVGGKIVNSAGGIVKFLSKVLPTKPYNAVVAIIDKITKPAAKAAFAAWLGTDAGRMWLATTTLGGLTELMDVTSVANRVELFNQMGGWFQNIMNVITKATEMMVDVVTGKEDDKSGEGEPYTPLSPEEMKAKGLTPQTQTKWSQDPNFYLPPGYKYNADNQLIRVPVDTSKYYNK
jgi:hypothetical protein